MKASDLLNALINVAEKGANIARIIRSESALLELLVQEKKGNQKNERFVQDFKTLADVLVQEVVKYDLSKKFPGIGDNIKGEESNKFTNTLGDSVTVQIQHSVADTQGLLSSVLDENNEAARILAEVIHREVNVDQSYDSQSLDLTLAVEDVGVWIDPIDSTAQYIQGETGEEKGGLVSEGLQCVAVLVGVYNRATGLPIIGVANQPFYKTDANNVWTGLTTWGVCISDVRLNSLNISQPSPSKCSRNPVILVSSSEDPSVTQALEKSFTLYDVAGAGYKLLGVCQGLADAYLLTRSSNYKWDCCGPHAILRSLGGGIIRYSDLYSAVLKNGSSLDLSSLEQIKYHVPDQSSGTGASLWCNHGGIIAYQTRDVLTGIASVIGS